MGEFSVERLRKDADEIELCGGGNEAACMRWAANEIERLHTALEAERAAVRRIINEEISAIKKQVLANCTGGIIEQGNQLVDAGLGALACVARRVMSIETQ